MIPNFYHSGEIGDIVYGLKALSKVPSANFYMGEHLMVPFDPNIEMIGWPNKNFTAQHFSFLFDFLERQPYIHHAIHGVPESIDYNLNLFRKEIFKIKYLNFADLHLHCCGFKIDKTDGNVPWLFSDVKKIKPISVIRVNRRINEKFPWKLITEKYHDDMIFLGTKSEHDEFTELTGHVVEWADFTDLLSVAEVINGAQLHIGNSTSISVCAEGLKKPMIFESEALPNNIWYELQVFNRENRITVGPDHTCDDMIMEKIDGFLKLN
jgi:hypothetical protein